MKVSDKKAKHLAWVLRQMNRQGRSWRTIAREDYGDRVHFATLNRIALSKGKWLPKDEQVLIVLGLIKLRSPYAGMPRYFHRTPEALSWFQHKKELVKSLSQASRKMTKGKSNE